MSRTVCELVQHPDVGWIASLSNHAQRKIVEGGASSKRSSCIAEVGDDPQRAKPDLDEPAYSPLVVAEGASCKVIFDGTLYNREELRGRFAAASSPDTNDAALILKAYLHKGEDVLHDIKGVFALLVWDERRNTLLCARDPLGVYPLFYASADRELLFSTSIDALVRHPRVADTVNRAALADHLLARWPQLEETYFEAVKRVPPGHAMMVRGAARQQYRYWDPIPVTAPVHDPRVNITEDELERFDELLDQAVNRCLQLGQAGVYLSGGLDSVSIAAVAADNSRRQGLPDPLALSLVFPTPETSEEDVQRRAALGLGLPHELMPLYEAAGSQGLLRSAMEMGSTWPAPLLSPWAPAYHNLGLEGKRRGCRVILTGQGGDEWLGVGPIYGADLLRALNFRGLYQFYKTERRSFSATRRHILRNLLWQYGARPWVAKASRAFLRRTAPGVLRTRRRWYVARSTPDWIAPDPVLGREIYHRMEQRLGSKPEVQGSFYRYEEQQAFDFTVWSMDQEEHFESGRRMGVPLRMPFWDADLVEFLRRTPPELLNQGGFTKGLVRQTLGRRFPKLGFERQKKVTAYGFYREVEMGEGADLWRTIGGAQALAELGVVDARALNSHISALISGDQPRLTYRIREVLMLEAWLRPRLQLSLPFSSKSNRSHEN